MSYDGSSLNRGYMYLLLRYMLLFLKIIGLLVLFFTLVFFAVDISEKHALPKSLAIVVYIIFFVVLVVLAFYICLLFDKEERLKAVKRVQKKMKKQNPIPREVFEQAFDKDHIGLAYQVKKEIAAFYNIEEEKISPDCNLWNSFALYYFEPFFLWALELKVFPELQDSLPKGTEIEPPEVTEDMNFADFVRCLKTYKDDFTKWYNIQSNKD